MMSSGWNVFKNSDKMYEIESMMELVGLVLYVEDWFFIELFLNMLG